MSNMLVDMLKVNGSQVKTHSDKLGYISFILAKQYGLHG